MMSGLTKKKLFLENCTGGLRTVKPGQSLLQNQQPLAQQVVVTTTIPLSGEQSNTTSTPSVTSAPSNSIVINPSKTITSTKYIPVQGKIQQLKFDYID